MTDEYMPIQARISLGVIVLDCSRHGMGELMMRARMPVEVDSVRLYDRAVRAEIPFAPGPLFSAKGAYRNCLRLNCTH